jgi:hypothetical protein
MPTLSNKARQGRLAAIAQLSNRRTAARHFHPARLALPLLAEPGHAPAPSGYLLH